jgi:hypothetical protein
MAYNINGGHGCGGRFSISEYETRCVREGVQVVQTAQSAEFGLHFKNVGERLVRIGRDTFLEPGETLFVRHHPLNDPPEVVSLNNGI